MADDKNRSDDRDPCQADFENEIAELVENVERYSDKDHVNKEAELEDVFEKE